jgi:hypothetical protein
MQGRFILKSVAMKVTFERKTKCKLKREKALRT